MLKLLLNLRATYRLFAFAGILLIYFVTSFYFYLTTKDPIQKRKRLIGNSCLCSKWILKAFNVTLICKNPIPENESSLLVGNHIGFIDIVCLGALQPSIFITSRELRNTPVLGQICEMGGCAYVDRKNRMKIQEELADIVRVLKEGFRVVLYAESVSSNGEQVLPFKKTLIMSAAFSERPVRPFCFNFREVNGGPVYYEQRDSLCWYGDQTFFPSIWRSFQLNKVTCEIEFLPLVKVTVDDDRGQVASKVHAMINAKFIPFKRGMNGQ